MTEENISDRSTEGFFFLSPYDAEMALTDKERIRFIEQYMDYKKPEQVLDMYEKTLQERLLRTPVGTIYLKHIQDYLLNQAKMDPGKVPLIPVYHSCHEGDRSEREELILEQKRSTEKQKTVRLKISVILNVLLVIAVIFMFAVATNSDHPNILNYRTAIINQYASWHQELDRREQVIREKERELKISED